MEVVELTKENIEAYIDECIKVQEHLNDSNETVEKCRFKDTVASPCSYFIAIVEGGRVAGLGVANKIVHPVQTNAYIDNVVAHPDFRGQGLFRIIMDALETKADEWGAKEVKLTCSRPGVQPLYEKRGYQERTSTKYYVKKL